MATIRDSTQAVSASATSLACTTPTGTVSGDVLVACMGHDTAGSTFSPPDGTWTQIENGAGAGAPGSVAAMYYKVLSASPDANYTFTYGGAANGFLLSLTAINPGSDTLAAVTSSLLSTTTTDTITATAVTGVADPSVLMAAFVNDQSATVTTAPSGMTLEEFADGAALDMAVYSLVNAGTGSLAPALQWSVSGSGKLAIAAVFDFDAGGPSAALTGTGATSLTEQRVRTGGYTLIATLTGDTFVASGATFDAQRQALINGLDSAQAEAAGWDAVVKAGITVGSVVRTSNTVCTITLPAFSTYQITATETVTWTLPAAALTLAGAVVASPTFTVTRGAMDLVQPVGVTNASGVPTTSSGSLTGDVAQLTRVTCTIDGVTLDTVRVITSR